MAKSFTDALVKAGLIKPEETQEAKRDESWRKRREKDAEETAAKMADTTERVPWEPAATGKIIDDAPKPSSRPKKRRR